MLCKAQKLETRCQGNRWEWRTTMTNHSHYRFILLKHFIFMYQLEYVLTVKTHQGLQRFHKTGLRLSQDGLGTIRTFNISSFYKHNLGKT